MKLKEAYDFLVGCGNKTVKVRRNKNLFSINDFFAENGNIVIRSYGTISLSHKKELDLSYDDEDYYIETAAELANEISNYVSSVYGDEKSYMERSAFALTYDNIDLITEIKITEEPDVVIIDVA